MSLARALTTRLQRTPRNKQPQISLPIELITATNPSAYSAPDISVLRATGYQPAMIETSTKSPALPSSPALPLTVAGTPIVTTPHADDLPTSPTDETPQLTDASSIGSSSPSRTRANSSEAAGDYFPSTPSSPDTSSLIAATPSLPRRAASHSKREHERLARKRSVRSSSGLSRSASVAERPMSPMIAEDEAAAAAAAAATTTSPLTRIISEEATPALEFSSSASVSQASEYSWSRSNSASEGSDRVRDGEAAKQDPFQRELSALEIMALEFAKITADTQAVAVREDVARDEEYLAQHGFAKCESWEYIREVLELRQAMGLIA